MFSVGCNVLSGNKVWGTTSIACSLMVSIYALGGISGANFNPAVSLALGASKAMNGPGLPPLEVFAYSVVQVAAAIVAAFSYTVLFHDDFNLAPSSSYAWRDAMTCEILYTFMLCFVVLNVAAASRSQPNEYYGIAIGFVIISAGVYSAGQVSGGCFNPAVAIGIDISSLSKGFGWCLAFLIWECVGAVLAAVLFRVVRPEDFGAPAGGAAAETMSEFIGTFFVVLTVGLNVMGRTPDGAWAIAASLLSMIYALGHVSGAHFNPAVTVAILASGRCPDLTPKKALRYVGAQVLGGVTAALTYSSVYDGASFKLGPGPSHTWGSVALAEIVFTFLLCYVVLCVAVSERTKSKDMFGWVIGACITCGVNAVGAISGGALNPAVAISIATGHKFAAGSGTWAAFFSLAEIVGAGAAAAAFAVTHAVDRASEKEAV